nr:unnamed protein product [Callosobruchus chinensis]
MISPSVCQSCHQMES